jgi:hypothetical protein
VVINGCSYRWDVVVVEAMVPSCPLEVAWSPACRVTLRSVVVDFVASRALSRVSPWSPAGLWVTVSFAYLFLIGR